ncbi:MAG: amidohydrolase family protein [Deltaproteobacteria bacterium]|nr:amidohydrolase family protein [Deltaproteobacteria bacterium]
MTPPRRCALALTLALALAFAVAGCAPLRAFLVPPDPHRPAKNVRKLALVDALVVAGAIHGRPGARAIAVRQGQILAVGLPADVTPLRGPETLVVKAPTAYVTPGLVDAHVHLEGAALLRDAADLRSVASPADLRAAVDRARPLAGDWLWGFGLSDVAWGELSQDDIDTACGETPCYLSRRDGHGGRLSSGLALRTSPLQQARISEARGRLAGELAREVWRSLPSPRLDRMRPLVQQVLDEMAATGIVEVHTMGESAALVHALRALEREGRLPVRVVVYLDAERPEAALLLEGRGLVRDTPRVRVAGVKLWLDGTLGGHSAALQLPYSDTPTSGELRYTDGVLRERIAEADRAGLQVALHAIGDRAVAQVARTLRNMVRSPTAPPVRIEHAQVVPPELREQLWGLAVECSVQPRHAGADAPFARARLGDDRLAWAYPALALAPVCSVRAGSDYPVAASDALADWRVMAATNPVELGGEATQGTVADLALAALTPGGTARGRPTVLEGRVADFVVWDRNPFAAAGARPTHVCVGGQVQAIVRP